MKYISIAILTLLFSLTTFADQNVQGFYKSNGTYVQGYTRSSPNSTVRDNYSYKGNTTPNTGELKGTEGLKNDQLNGMVKK